MEHIIEGGEIVSLFCYFAKKEGSLNIYKGIYSILITLFSLREQFQPYKRGDNPPPFVKETPPSNIWRRGSILYVFHQNDPLYACRTMSKERSQKENEKIDLYTANANARYA